MAKKQPDSRAFFAAKLKELMERNNLRQSELARYLDVSKSTMSDYVHGNQIPRIEKIEKLAEYFGLSVPELMGELPAADSSGDNIIPIAAQPILRVYKRLNSAGQSELIRYGDYLGSQQQFRAEKPPEIEYIKRYLVPAAAGYAAPIEGSDYELLPRDPSVPHMADFCLNIDGDSMEPYISSGQLIYVRRDSPLKEFDVGVFYVDGDVYCKQWCVDYSGTLHLLSANPKRQDANISISPSSGRSCICFGKVLLDRKPPRPVYF